ncbi:MAG: hypothetical protein CM15mP73_4800 [Hyphomicrobiales bacterium]|nr:MAG: hypothetical protein CM15mP73_4800 [Hyphomicrobiales bacterium]
MNVKDWSIEIYAFTMPVFSILLMVFVLISGWAVDKWSAKDLTKFFLLPLVIGCMILAYGKSEATMVIFMMFAGITSGFATSIAGSLWAELYGTKYLGEIKSVVTSGVIASTALSPGLMGYPFLIEGISIESQVIVVAIYDNIDRTYDQGAQISLIGSAYETFDFVKSLTFDLTYSFPADSKSLAEFF